MAFDRLQAAGWGLYRLSEPNIPDILLHAVYVVVPTGFEVILIFWLARQVRDNAEVAALAESLSRGGREGIGQVNTAMGQLDQSTQQNAALVEQSAASAEALRGQAQRLKQAVSVFELGATAEAATETSRGPAPALAAPIRGQRRLAAPSGRT
ncbi:MAG: hypothetical protein P3W97_006200 [Tepidimonas sp.]|uniref:hypothetical protein n=1 Tax=Tepidimonas sp. TaxID=2002775 RepID=UPI00259F082F|nr:hypothetical protein [Tepidimonas sp.]MDM7456839.1 hypothetical protein [Tepidimonas sp.]